MADNKKVYAQRHYEAALDSFDHGHYEKALEQITKAIGFTPSNPDLWSTKAVFHHRMNDLTLAIEAYKEALVANADHVFSHFNLGLISMKLGLIPDAIRSWEYAARINPKDVDAIFNIAVALSQLGKIKEATAFYERVLKINPDHVQSHQNLGIIFRDARNFARAKHHFARLKLLDSTFHELVTKEIVKCQEQEFLDQLSADSQKLTREMGSSPENYSDKVVMALSEIVSGNLQEARNIATQILEEDPDNVQAKVIIGQALVGIGSVNDAIAHFHIVTNDHPDNREAWFHLANLFLDLGELEKALESFTRVKKLDPGFPLIDENIQSLESQTGKKE